jgi:hypothetical protein
MPFTAVSPPRRRAASLYRRSWLKVTETEVAWSRYAGLPAAELFIDHSISKVGGLVLRYGAGDDRSALMV